MIISHALRIASKIKIKISCSAYSIKIKIKIHAIRIAFKIKFIFSSNPSKPFYTKIQPQHQSIVKQYTNIDIHKYLVLTKIDWGGVQ